MCSRSFCRFWVQAILILTVGGLAGALPAQAETRVQGEIRGDVEWNKQGSPYIVTGDLVVPEKSTLRIGPGVTVRFKENIASREGINPYDLELLVRGTLIITGAEADTVILTSDATTPRWTDWHGVVVEGENARADIDAATIEYSNYGVSVHKGNLVVKNSVIHRCEEAGIFVVMGNAVVDNLVLTQIGNSGGTGFGISFDRGGSGEIKNSFIIGTQNGVGFSRESSGLVERTYITNCVGRGVMIGNSNPEIRECTVAQNDLGVVCYGGSVPVVKRNNIFQNGTADLKLDLYTGDPVKLDFSNNWWGETGLGLIEEMILDGTDDPNVKAFVNIEPVLSEASTSQVDRVKQN